MEIINYIQDFADKSQSTYHVNPWIFLFLFFGSAIPLYLGYFLIARSALKIEGRKLKRKKLNKGELKTGIIISVIAWWIPYVYVIMFGRSPFYLWLMFFAFVIVMGLFFVLALRKRISNAKKGLGN